MSDSKQPVNIVDFRLAIKELHEIELNNIKSRLTVSIKRLEESNKLMKDLLTEIVNDQPISNPDFDELNTQDNKGDIELYNESIKENDFVISNQRQRIESIDEELAYRGVSSEPKAKVTISHKLNAEGNIVNEDNNLIDSTAPNSVFI